MLNSPSCTLVPGSSSFVMRGVASHDEPATKVPAGMTTLAPPAAGADDAGAALDEAAGSDDDENSLLQPCAAHAVASTDTQRAAFAMVRMRA